MEEGLGNYLLADWKTWSERLVGNVGYRGRKVVDADPRGEAAKVWKALMIVSVKWFRTIKWAHSRNCSCVTPSWFSCVLGFPE